MTSPDRARSREDLGWLRHRRVRPAPARPVPAPPAPASRVPAPPAPTLDLAPPGRPRETRRRVRPGTLPYPRVQPGTTVALTAARPTVTLTRLQSGVGQLRLALARGADAGDMAAGLVCQTVDGATHVVQRLGDALATPAAPLPMVRLVAEAGLDTVLIDLRQVGRLRRALLYGYSPGVAVLSWDGVVVATLHDGSRIEAPFDLPPLSGTVALLTVYAVQGELVLRSELEAFAGPPEMAAQAYGYRYGWLGRRLPTP